MKAVRYRALENSLWYPTFLLAALSSAAANRQDAFINYSEASRSSEWDPAEVATVALVSSYGEIRLHLRRDWAPQACEAVARMAAGPLAACPGCTFYRHEPAPENWGVNGYYGPPYGLLQGGLPGLTRPNGVENAAGRPVRLGTAGFIGDDGGDFFIGTVDHSEWGAAFTPFAQVQEEDLGLVVPRIPYEPYRNSTDSYNFTTRWLLTPVPFKLVPLRREALLAARSAGGSGGEAEAL